MILAKNDSGVLLVAENGVGLPDGQFLTPDGNEPLSFGWGRYADVDAAQTALGVQLPQINIIGTFPP